ncbi:MAG TPA: carbamoyl-phosphate synthase large subunit, partial [Synergistaceae bacterium]|nr:carbamoyl-phosphate synthase large subunit [Synergistaceae bacterium]
LGVSANFAGALREALAAMGTSIPSRGKVLFSVHDRAKSACCASAALYAAAGWELFATPGTAEHLRKWGIPVRSVPKGEKLVQRITSKEWDLLVNIPGNRQTALRDGFAIRRAAVEGGLLCFHSLECANALGVSLPEVSGGHEC